MTELSTQPGGTGNGGDGANSGGTGTQQSSTQPGGTGNGGDGANSGGTGTQQSSTQPGGTGTQQSSTQPGGTGTGGTDTAAELTLLRSQLAEARSDAAKARTIGKQTAAQEAEAALLGKLTKALGLARDQAPDPEKLAADLTTAREEHRSTLVELQVLKLAGAEGGDPGALLDSRTFLASIKDLDPKSEGFAGSLKAAVSQAVKENPKLGVGTPTTQGGGEIKGGTKDKGDDDLNWDNLDKLAKGSRKPGGWH
jgi:hypothetical protein